MMKKLLYFIVFLQLAQIVRTGSKDSKEDDSDDSDDSKNLLTIKSISTSLTYVTNPVVSSLAGGTTIYIRVSGHSQNVKKNTVYVGTFPCVIPTGGVNEDYIRCQTSDSKSTTDIYNLQVTLISNKKTAYSGPSRVVHYQGSSTPQINEVFPSSGFAKSTVYVYGSNQISTVGDGKDVGDILKIMIGDHQCNTVDIPQTNYYTYIKCTQPSQLQAGNWNISQKLTQGQAKKSSALRFSSLNSNQYFQFTHLPTISQISSNKGEEGGQKLTIKGTGFSKKKKNNTVSVDGNPCKITKSDSKEIKCTLKQKNASFSTRLPTNSINQTSGYISGTGLNYIRYSYVYDINKLINDFRAGVSSGSLSQRGFRAQLREYTYNNYVGQIWSGYFTAPVTGKYTFRGFAAQNFAFYLSTNYGTAQPPASPLIYSYSPTARWSSFYYDDISTAQASVNLTGGMSYYMQAYHSSYWNSFFKISVDVPNNNTDLPNQVFEVHKLFLNTSLQPQVVVYSMSGGSNNSRLNLKIIRTDNNGNIYYNNNVTIAYGCSDNQFYSALMNFDSFYPYGVSVVRKLYTTNNTLINSTMTNATIVRYDYEVSFFFLRQTSVQNQNFTITRYNFSSGSFSKSIKIQHSPLISGNFSFTIGGVQFNNINYYVAESTLQSIIRSTIKGYQNVQVQFITTYGCQYWCTWVISYRGVFAPIPAFVLNTANLKGGITQPNITFTIRRPYSSSIIFEPIDYRFLGTASYLPSVSVQTNGLRAVCTGNCAYQFIKIANVTYRGYHNSRLTLFIEYSTNTTQLSDLQITVNDKPCIIQAGFPHYLNCTVQSENGQIPLTAGQGILEVNVRPYGIIPIKEGINPLMIPLVLSGVNSSSGGLNGGSINTLYGTGFSPDSSIIQVNICGQSAPIWYSSYNQITFFMPSCTVPGNTSFLVTVGGMGASSIYYEYVSNIAPIISSVYPRSSSPTKKTPVWICGSGFGSDKSVAMVYITNTTGRIYQLKILTINNSCIKAGLSGGLPGYYKMQVILTNGQGLAQPNVAGADSFAYEFSITSVFPNTGSYFGGTLLNITGINFATQYSDTLVYVGYALNWFCRIENISQTSVTCRTPPSHPKYLFNQSLDVSMSSKVYMMNNCPYSNCQFTYMDQQASPNLTSLSTTVASSGPIQVVGFNFISSVVNDTCQIVLSNQDGSNPYIIPTSFWNYTYTQFILMSNIPAGNYTVKIRNSIGESNGLPLTVNWVSGNPSQTMMSIEGGIITFTGGSGYPLALGDQYYLTLYAPSLNTYYSVNITGYNQTGLSVQVPPNPNSTFLYINFVSPMQTTSQLIISSKHQTPYLFLISSQVVLAGTNNIVLQKNDSIINLAILSITLISTLNTSNNINIVNWFVSTTFAYNFTAKLYPGSYRILINTQYGFCNVNSTINVLTNNGSVVAKQASFAGDSVTIIGVDLSPSSYININGFIGNIINYNTSAVTYRIPALISNSTQNYYKLKKVSLLKSQLLTTFSDSNNTLNSSTIIDGDKTTYYSSSSFSNYYPSQLNSTYYSSGLNSTYYSPALDSTCWVGVDVGAGLAAFIDRISYLPMLDWVNVGYYLFGSVFEGSNDNQNWTILGKVDQSVRSGWNTIKFNTSILYRYVRFRHNSTSKCSIAQIKVYGIIYTSQNIALSSQFSSITYNDGYNTKNYSNVLQFRQDRTPVVDSINPPYGDVFGGYNISITGQNLNFTGPMVYIDSVLCVIFSANSTNIICTVGARSTIPQQTSFRVVVGTAQSVLNAVFLYVLKWSDDRTWGVDLPPIDGDLVFIPAGMTLLIDQSTPHLLGITTQDGTIIFSNDTDVTMYTGFITMNGGKLIAGTQANPLHSNLKIVLQGNLYGAQQPVFGNKGIGCLNCKLSIYGKPRAVWTSIALTINPGDTNFTLNTTVDWKVGEQIVVASTSFDHNESESKFITAINGNVFTVDSPFTYQHVSVVQSYSGSEYLAMSAEVGLLTRNIIITGDSDSNITQYGAHLLATKSSNNNLQVKIAFTQFTQCGQPYIPGRYCIYFSKAREVTNSYIRGNSVHNSFARLIGLLNTQYLTIENNIGYRIKGHNIFLQSGRQVHNTIRNNLLISSLTASNMLQSDYSVASIWVTHPTNHIYDNHAAGSDYYGIVFQIADYSNTFTDICPTGNTLGFVANNVIHSNKNYGMRISKLYARKYPCQPIRNDYYPDDPWVDNPSIASIFYNFVVYKNLIYGVLAEQVGNMIFNNFTVAENYVAGIQIFVANFTKEMITISNSTIVGQSMFNFEANSSSYQNMYGVVTPRTGQTNLTNTRFYNFMAGSTALVTCSQCNQGQFMTNIGNQIFVKGLQFTSITGIFVNMLGYSKDIIYDLDGSLSLYFFNYSQSSATIVYSFNHIAQYHTTACQPSRLNQSSWGGLIMCNSDITIRRILFTNIIGTYSFYDFYWANMYVYPITNVSEAINLTNVNTNIMTTVPSTYAWVEKPYSWSLPFVTGMTYQVTWGSGYNTITDYNHLSISTTPLYNQTDSGVVFKIPFILNRELYSIGPMRGYQFPSNSQLIPQNVYPPSPSSCINGQYSHINDQGSRMLSICQSGKNKTKFQYTQVNAIFCKYVCPPPPPPPNTTTSSSTVGIVVKQSFVRLWSNASQWPNETIPQYMQDVYVNANWTILLDMDPFPANYMIIDGTVVADDTRDVFITAKSINIRAGNISIGYPATPFTHQCTIQINNTQDDPGWVIDPLVEGNKFITVTGSLNLYGSPPYSTITELTQTAFANSSNIYVSSSSGWQVGDSIVLSPSFGNYQEYEQVTITSMNNSDGSISISPPLNYTHYGSYQQQIISAYGSIDVNTQVGHLTRNIKIISGPDYSHGLDLLIYGYWDDLAQRVGSATFYGVEVQGANFRFLNAKNGITPSSISSSSFYNMRTAFLDVQNSNQLSFLSNVFYNSGLAGITVSRIDTFGFNKNLMIGVKYGGCFSLLEYLDPTGNTIKNNFCLGSSGYGFAFPHIKCSELQTNPMAFNTAGSCTTGFIFNNIQTQDNCKAFSYIQAYACKIGQTCNPMRTSKLVFQHFVLVDNQRGATLKFGSDDDEIDTEHIAQFSYSYIAAISRPLCVECYGANAISCSNIVGMRMLSVSGDGQSLYSSYNLQSYDDISTAEVINSNAYLTSVIFDNFRASYPSSPQCTNNFALRSHPKAYDAVALHTLYNCFCSNCDNDSYILADPNDPTTLGWQGGCGSILCTGKSNYLVIDPNGTFLTVVGTLVPDNKMIGYNEPFCSYSSNMNAFTCQRTDLAILAYQSTAADYNTRIMWPVNLTYEGSNYSTLTNGWRQWDWVGSVPQNHRLGRFLTIVKLNSVYNMTFTSMAPLSMVMQIQKRQPFANASNNIIVQLRYPLPNMIRVHANGMVVDPIPLTDTGLRRQINRSSCGQNVYFYKNYTTNFVITQGDCVVEVQLLDTVELTTKFAMTTDQFFTGTVMSSYINNLCALLGIQDTSRVKIVGVFSGSTVVNTMILPPSSINSTDNSTNSTSTNGTSANGTAVNSSEPSLVAVQQILSQSLQSGTYASVMTNATGFQVLTGSSTLYLIQTKQEDSSISSSSVMLIGIIVGCVVGIIALILLFLYCKRKMSVTEDQQVKSNEEKQVASDSVLFSNESAAIVQVIERDHKNRQTRVTNNMKKNNRRAKQNTNLQVKQLDLEPIDFEE